MTMYCSRYDHYRSEKKALLVAADIERLTGRKSHVSRNPNIKVWDVWFEAGDLPFDPQRWPKSSNRFGIPPKN